MKECIFKRPRSDSSRCQDFLSIAEVFDAFERGETDILNSIPQIKEMMEKLSDLNFRTPFYISPGASGVCLNQDALSQRGEIIFKRTVTVEPDEKDKLAEEYQDYQDERGNRRRVIVGKNGSRVVLFKGPKVKLADIGCFDPSQEKS